MKPCPYCATNVPEGALFCGHCGSRMAEILQAQPAAPGLNAYDLAPPQYAVPPVLSGTPGAGPNPSVAAPNAYTIGGPAPVWTAPANQTQALPEELKGLNWGAFLLPFVWGPANQVWIGLVGALALLPTPLFLLISLVVSIYLLIKGNELAWRSGRRWESVEQFRAVQSVWLKAGLIATGISLLLVFLMFRSLMG
ncbi:MAG TPA: zinc ribbon domain-containing protein [Chthonomonadaceae bacterium]|nr:zinc ribbon domain-containing protein [Chthonomonadaceae bacterium]